MDQELISHTVT